MSQFSAAGIGSGVGPAAGTAGIARELTDQAPALRRYVRGLLATDQDRVEDVVQETMLRAWQHRDRLDWTGRPIRLWLFRTARNLVIDCWRKDRAVSFGLAADLPGDDADHADMAGDVSDRCVLTEGLRRLPPAQREVLVHVHLLDRATDDVAMRLGIPAGTVKSRTHHAVRALRRSVAAA